jgi:FMN phosphatase YigB (HAD superfamily)
MFEALIREFALEKEDTLAVGDRELDILAAQAAGLRSCFFGSNPCQVTPDFSITHYEELKRLISA